MVKNNLGIIRNRLKIILAEKEVKEGRRYTYADIQDVTGISQSTLSDWANGNLGKIAMPTLAALCAFFNCQPGDLLEYIPSTSTLAELASE